MISTSPSITRPSSVFSAGIDRVPISCSRSSRCERRGCTCRAMKSMPSSVIRSRTRCEYGHHSAWKNSSTSARRSSGLTNSSKVARSQLATVAGRDRAHARRAADAHRRRDLAEVVARAEQRPLAACVLRHRQQARRARCRSASRTRPRARSPSRRARTRGSSLAASSPASRPGARRAGRRGTARRRWRARCAGSCGPIVADVAELAAWRYCPRCAAELRGDDARKECPRCGFVAYASSKPTASAVIVGDDGRVLARAAPARALRRPLGSARRVPGGGRAPARRDCGASSARRPASRSSPATSSACGWTATATRRTRRRRSTSTGRRGSRPASRGRTTTSRSCAGSAATSCRRQPRLPHRRGPVSLAEPAGVARPARPGTRAASRRAPARRRRPPARGGSRRRSSPCVARALLPGARPPAMGDVEVAGGPRRAARALAEVEHVELVGVVRDEHDVRVDSARRRRRSRSLRPRSRASRSSARSRASASRRRAVLLAPVDELGVEPERHVVQEQAVAGAADVDAPLRRRRRRRGPRAGRHGEAYVAREVVARPERDAGRTAGRARRRRAATAPREPSPPAMPSASASSAARASSSRSSSGSRTCTCTPRARAASTSSSGLSPPPERGLMKSVGCYAVRPSERSSAPLGCAPTANAAASPPLKRIMVGIDATP